MGASCNNGSTLVAFVNATQSGATLNWIYSNATPTISATGVALGTTTPTNEYDVGYDNNRIEGEFVFADANSVTTIYLHAFDGNADGCEIRGTAERVLTG
jgi:hypothetical protein